MPPSFPPQPTNKGRVSRKRKAPLDDNGDPVIVNPPKRKKTDLSKPVPPKKKSVPEKVAPAMRRPSIEVEEMPDEGDTTSSERPHNPWNILEAADGSDDDVSGALPEVISAGSGTDEEDLPKIVEDDKPEDEEEELSLYLFLIRLLAVDFCSRAHVQKVNLTGVRVLREYSWHPV